MHAVFLHSKFSHFLPVPEECISNFQRVDDLLEPEPAVWSRLDADIPSWTFSFETCLFGNTSNERGIKSNINPGGGSLNLKCV